MNRHVMNLNDTNLNDTNLNDTNLTSPARGAVQISDFRFQISDY